MKITALITLVLLQLAFSFEYSALSLFNDPVICHTGFCLEYAEEHEQARWVSYTITIQELNNKIVKRKNNFRSDPNVKTASATKADYKKSGYDRGHLFPAGIARHSKFEMSESFYMSNMSPQKPGFNRGIWKKLESLIRKWTETERKLYVFTGPILTKGLPTIGDGVSIPDYYYKVIISLSEPSKGIGFVLPNEKSNKPLESFVVSIDDIEKRTGIDFFVELQDELEKQIESKADFKLWKK